MSMLYPKYNIQTYYSFITIPPFMSIMKILILHYYDCFIGARSEFTAGETTRGILGGGRGGRHKSPPPP